MLCLVLLVLVLTGRCRGYSDNSSTSPMLLLPPVPAPRRMSAAQVDSLRRQLMRDNYDYQHSGDEGQPNITENASDTKGEADHLPLASELAQAHSNAFRAENVLQEHYKPHGKFEQRGQNEQGRQHDQPGEYERRGQHEQRGRNEMGHHHTQPGEYEHRVQYEQPTEHEQRGQYDQYGPHKQGGQNEQREHSEQQGQLGQFDEQEQSQSIETKPRATPSLDDALVAPPVAAPFTDELAVREYPPDWRDIQPDQTKEYNPSYYKKSRDAYDPPYPALMQRKPFSDLRGSYKEQYGQNDAGHDMRAQAQLASNAHESPDQDYTPDEQETFDQQGASGSQDDEGSDFSVSKTQPKINNEFVTRSTTRANRQLYYTPAPAQRNAPPHRVHYSLDYLNQNSPLYRNRNALPPLRSAPPSHRSAPPPHRKAPDHNISKKDLLYYMDENQLRRRNNDESPNVPDEDHSADDQLPSPQPSYGPNSPAGTRTSPSNPARRPAPTESRAAGELVSTSRARRSFVVTVSAANVTYKLLLLKSRSGRRQDERRILEERGPAGVAIMSLDHAPLPAFRLPRARRQYMHAPHHHHYHRRPSDEPT